jgi:ATP-dependent Clp protease ATP-binding subunit ClpX
MQTRVPGPAGCAPSSKRLMMNVMYEIPSLKDVKRCIISADTVLKREEPQIITVNDLRQAS